MKRFLKMAALVLLTGGFLLAGGNLFAAESTVTAGAQQDQACRGVVLDTQGLGVIGASVLIKGQPVALGTVTDFDGNFVQTNAKKGDVLVISCIGYVTQEVVWDGQPVRVVLAEDNEMLAETVVTAYGGRQLRSKVTNSIASVKEDVISSGMHTNPAQALSGAVAGLQVQQVSGDPGATPTVILRGGTSLNGSGSPLVIVDGAQRSLADLNPNDIESIEVLKDAGATAIYGARAANGVILVTTKQGKEGHSAINVRAKYSVNYYQSEYDYLGSEDYLYYMRLAYKRASSYVTLSDGTVMGATNMNGLSGAQPYGTGNIYFNADGTPANGNRVNAANWGVMKYEDRYAFLLNEGWRTMTDPVYGDKLIFYDGMTLYDTNIVSPALSQDYGIDFQGGNDKGHYYASLGYNNSNGNAYGNDYKRLSFVFNGDYKIRPWLTSTSSFNYARTQWTPIKNGNSAQNYFSRVFTVPPTFRMKNPDGEWLVGVRGNSDGNVLVYYDALDRDYETNKFNMTQAFTVDFTRALSFKLSGSWYYEDTWQEYFNHDYMTGVGPRYSTTRGSQDYYNRNLNQTYNAILNYNKSFDRHNVSAMLGAEFLNFGTKGFYAYGQGAPTDEFQDLELTTTEEGKRDIDSWHSQNRVLSFFGKVDYDYDAKYLLSLVARYDGYSRLADGHRWGFFPGVSAGWVFSKEDFMQPYSDVISFAKLRVSYGANGNLDTSIIGNYTVQGAYSAQTNYNGSGATLLSSVPNPYLVWEKSWTFETGLDMSFFENKFNANVTYYNRHTSDKIASITLPSHSGASSFLSNNGEVQNQGVEFELGWRAVNTRDWKVNVNLIGAYNKNKIVKLPYNGLENNRQSAIQVYDPNTGDLIWVGGYQEGQTPGDIYAFEYNGIYKSYDEIPGNLIDKSSGNNGSNGKWLYGPAAWAQLTDAQKRNAFPIQPGDAKWTDVNGDGVIDNYDLVKIGNTVPKWTGGLTFNAAWKGLALTARMDYALGYKIIDYKTPWIIGNMQGTYNTVSLVKRMYDPETGQGDWPMYTWADQLGKRNVARETSQFIFNGDYLAFREITLSYSVPASIVNKINMQGLTLSVSGQNLGYWTECKHIATPEYGRNTWGNYRLPRTVIFGLNVTF